MNNRSGSNDYYQVHTRSSSHTGEYYGCVRRYEGHVVTWQRNLFETMKVPFACRLGHNESCSMLEGDGSLDRQSDAAKLLQFVGSLTRWGFLVRRDEEEVNLIVA